MADAVPRGRFVWHELMTTDPSAAQSFYTDLIGWTITKWEGGEQDYAMWTNAGATIGGVMELPEQARQMGSPPHWLPYVAVANVDESVAKTKQLGGKVYVEPMDIPDVGRIAVLADPQGAVFAVYTAAGDFPGHDGPPEVGEFSWHELMTTDWKKAFDFYHELFGWEKTGDYDMGPELGVYQMFGRYDPTAADQPHGTPLGGMFNKSAEMPGPPAWLLYARVDDVDAAAERIKELGGQVVNDPMDVPGGDRIAQGVDPQGAFFAIHARKKE